VVRPDQPICGGALHSPGFYPQSYLCRPEHGGYWMLQALGQRYGFDPATTPWSKLSQAAQEAFLFGEEQVELAPEASRMASRTVLWRGIYRVVSGWDIGGQYTEQVPCPVCDGTRLRPEHLEVSLAGLHRHHLHQRSVAEVGQALATVPEPVPVPGWARCSFAVARRRLGFLRRIGLGYLHLDRLCTTLSAGEVQRVKLTSLLGSDLTGMTVLLDEPSRGMHPSEVAELAAALGELRDAGNTVVAVDHDPTLTGLAQHLVVMGPGAGRAGGTVVAAGTPAQVRHLPAARSLLDQPPAGRVAGPRRLPAGWMRVRRPTEHNLRGDDVPIPLGVLAGICGVSGSGKSTLAIDITARALAPAKLTSSVAQTQVNQGDHEGIEGAPPRVIHADQSRAGVRSPGAFLGVMAALRRAYVAADEALARGLDEEDLVPGCDACKGRGSVRAEMGFLPSVEQPCDACEATRYRVEARSLLVRGDSLAGLERCPLEEVAERWRDREAIARPLGAAARLGLGYLALGQQSGSLSGGERQRLKLARELARPTRRPSLYILDEPTVGLHALDTRQLVAVLDSLVEQGHSVLVVDHDPQLLRCCDWLVELGPGGGPDGGRVVATGTPERVAAGSTPTAPYLRAVRP
jgi:excinuclease ABC subunit A